MLTSSKGGSYSNKYYSMVTKPIIPLIAIGTKYCWNPVKKALIQKKKEALIRSWSLVRIDHIRKVTSELKLDK